MSDTKFPSLSENALKILDKRKYLWEKANGSKETVDDMFRRVAKFISSAEFCFDNPRLQPVYEEIYFEMMRSLRFMPNTPTLVNANRPHGQLAACVVLPLEDSMDGIMTTMKSQALLQKAGTGTGFNFGRLRERGALVKSTGMKAAGPIPVIKFMNYMMSEFIVQGGMRSGANMAVLPVDSPDIEEFITFKKEDGSCKSFNVSIGASDVFMRAVEEDGPFSLTSRVDGHVIKTVQARQVFNMAVKYAWETGDPGLLFMDTINRANPTPQLGRLEATNPCSEVPLLPMEECTLGHLNLGLYFTQDAANWVESFNWPLFKQDIHNGVRFLDSVVEVNDYPIKEIEMMHKQTNRKIGLGVMGLADLLVKLEIPYDSLMAVDIADKIGNFYKSEADKASCELGKERGSFGAFQGSAVEAQGWTHMRNACRTCVAPTGTTALICGASTGIEPIFSLILKRNQAGMTMHEMNPLFEACLKKLSSTDVLKVVDYFFSNNNSVAGCPYLPPGVDRLFQQANDISIDGHLDMLAVWTKNTDLAVSKTINMPNSATVEDIRQTYMRAWKLGTKGITVYRDGCRADQPLSHASVATQSTLVTINADVKKEELPRHEPCKECGGQLQMVDGCTLCPSCGYSACGWTAPNTEAVQ